MKNAFSSRLELLFCTYTFKLSHLVRHKLAFQTSPNLGARVRGTSMSCRKEAFPFTTSLLLWHEYIPRVGSDLPGAVLPVGVEHIGLVKSMMRQHVS